METVLHVAVALNNVIGRDGAMPWRLSADLKRFKRQTLGQPVVMGRKTFQSIGRALPGRVNIVVTRDPEFRAEGVTVAHSLGQALALGRAQAPPGASRLCVIGGGEIYREAIEHADALRVTHVLAVLDGDTFFPPIDPDTWREVEREEVPAGPDDTHPTRYAEYRRRAV